MGSGRKHFGAKDSQYRRAMHLLLQGAHHKICLSCSDWISNVCCEIKTVGAEDVQGTGCMSHLIQNLRKVATDREHNGTQSCPDSLTAQAQQPHEEFPGHAYSGYHEGSCPLLFWTCEQFLQFWGNLN